jgi:hypothetical protein
LGGFFVDDDNAQLLVQYDSTADPARLKEFLDKLTAVQALELPYRVVSRAVDYNERLFADRSQEIAADEGGRWSERLGLTEISGAGPDFATGEIIVHTTAGAVTQVGDRFGFPIRIEGGFSGATPE